LLYLGANAIVWIKFNIQAELPIPMLVMFHRRQIRPILAAFLLVFAPLLAHAVQSPHADDQGTSRPAPPPADAADKTRLLETLSRLDPQLHSLLDSAVSALRQSVESGPPFLIGERRARIGRLEKLLKDADAALAEKFRCVMEAYRVELGYTKTVDAQRDTLRTGEEERLVDFLSVGRLALYYQTLDGHESGIWRSDRWQRLSGEENEAVTQGLRTARKIDPPQLIVLPLPGTKSGSAARAAQIALPAPAEAETAKPAPDSPAEADAQLTAALAAKEGLFMNIRESAAQLKPYYQQSLLAGDAGSQRKLISRLADDRHMPAADELAQLFASLQAQLDASGRISTFRAPVYAPDGQASEKEVLRLGGFSFIADGRYLVYAPEVDRLAELPRQPASHLLELAQDFPKAEPESLAPVALDPSGGQILQLVVQVPNLRERIDQGGMVGYSILALAALACVLSVYRFIELTLVENRIRRQLQLSERRLDNPLGRVLARLDQATMNDEEALYLTVEEALTGEQAKLGRALAFLKLVAAIAPMLGLLGTVTGMIKTFQAIALHGSADPKLMSGGISEALVTTVEGLVTAIPILLLHSLLTSKRQALGSLLEAHAAAALAQRFERRHAVTAAERLPHQQEG
jgi:biopolymer transport protein ExbB